ncbi:glycosidase [Melghirimyces profundicolus]|uniref:Glycosidase n=1 Tax=Melghirimyces profundicolus TaxID=1242148 RepID=A0A2T6C9R2_9BACL|nr:glycoside hydrolase family 13 protein [Melghirimyces profundicolus]PTX65003.1 glycosidase [Melghirimyces profundicolus]
MLKEAIYHRPEGAWAYPLDVNCLRIRLRAKRGDRIRCRLLHADRYSGEGDESIVDLEKTATDTLFDYYEGVIPTATRRVRYVFYLEDPMGGCWYGEKGIFNNRREAGDFQFAYICHSHLFEIPDWAYDGVVYQIFPERFYNGDPGNDPAEVEPWNKGARPKANSFYGGDLQGIIDQLSYLKELGVNLIYLTPIFKSPSNHKYDTTDYYRIDPHFGDLDTLKKLVDKAHRLGMRVMLDAVINHAGYGFFAFQDVLKNGADSKYADWFYIQEFPVVTEPVPNYETFANDVWTMPKLNMSHPEVAAYFLDMAEYWIKEAGIDGWRLDVANEVDPDFWRAFRKRVKKANPDALIVGEIWHDSGPWLQGDQFDSVMNYLFRDAVMQFFATREIGADVFDAQLAKSRMLYREQALYAMFNLLDSHDTERFLTACGGREERMRLAVLFQMTYLGMPMIYYGDEAGMDGETDPDCRRPMLWRESDRNGELFTLYQALLRIRRQHPALRRGDYRTWYVDPAAGIYGYLRRTEEDCVGVILNNGGGTQTVSLDTHLFGEAPRLHDPLHGKIVDGRDGRVTVTLAPYEGRMISTNSG